MSWIQTLLWARCVYLKAIDQIITSFEFWSFGACINQNHCSLFKHKNLTLKTDQIQVNYRDTFPDFRCIRVCTFCSFREITISLILFLTLVGSPATQIHDFPERLFWLLKIFALAPLGWYRFWRGWWKRRRWWRWSLHLRRH